MPAWNPILLKPCGTLAAYRRHLRYGERTCTACRQAQARYHTPHPVKTMDAAAPDRREIRNGLPLFRPYVYRGSGRDAYDGTCLFEEIAS